MMYCILVVLLAATVTVQSIADDRRTLCGRELAKAHFMFCYSAAATEAPMDLQVAVDDLEDGSKVPGRFTYKMERAVDHAQYVMRLVDTCCMKPCSLDELLDNC